MHIGIIGAGQLGQMLGIAAQELGDSCTFVDPSEAPPAGSVGEIIPAAFDDPEALAELARTCDVVTYEFENVPVEALLAISDQVPVFPPPDALRLAQDRLAEKQLFEHLDIPLPAYRRVDSAADLHDAVATIGLPLVVKTRRLGYDGKGQAVLQAADQVQSVFRDLGPAALIAEQCVPFDFEVSVIGARNASGDIVTYPLTHNEHADGILRLSRAPVDTVGLTEQAGTYMHSLLEHLDYVGVLALELFVMGDRLLANEFAPRVHNSGHWTIEGAETSQFKNHLLAITDRPLASSKARGYAGMINLIGKIPDSARNLANGQLHDYGKAPLTGRKLGHITVVADSAAARDRQLAEIGDSVT